MNCKSGGGESVLWHQALSLAVCRSVLGRIYLPPWWKEKKKKKKKKLLNTLISNPTFCSALVTFSLQRHTRHMETSIYFKFSCSTFSDCNYSWKTIYTKKKNMTGTLNWHVNLFHLSDVKYFQYTINYTEIFWYVLMKTHLPIKHIMVKVTHIG